jgi:hypothetical protein
VATTLEELADRVGPIDPGDPVGRTTTTLDVETAIVFSWTARVLNPMQSQSTTYLAAMHEGRPFLVRIGTGAETGIEPFLRGILEGFRFGTGAEGPMEPSAIVQPASIDGVRTFAAADGTFEIALPDAWEATSGLYPSTLYLVRGPLSLSIAAADAAGRVTKCDGSAGTFEPCPMIRETTLDGIEDAIGTGYGRNVWQQPIASSSTLDGESARTVSVIGGMPPNHSIAYMVAIHDGRAFIIRAAQTGGIAIDELPELVAGFRFTDR